MSARPEVLVTAGAGAALFGDEVTFDITYTAAADKLVVFVRLFQSGGFTFYDPPTVGGVAGTRADRTGAEIVRVAVYEWLKNPPGDEAQLPAAGEHEVRVTSNGNQSFLVSAHAIGGAKQELTPAALIQKHFVTSVTSSTRTVTAPADSLMLDGIMTMNTSESALNAGTGQTVVYKELHNRVGAGSRKDGDGSTAMEWTWSISLDAAHIALAIAPSDDPDPPGAPDIDEAVALSDSVVEVRGLVAGTGADETELLMATGGDSPFDAELGVVVETWGDGDVPANFKVENLPSSTLHTFGLRSRNAGGQTDSGQVTAATLPRPYVRTGVHEDECEFPLEPPPGKEIHRFDGIVYQIGKHEDDGAGQVNETITVKIDGTQVEQFVHNDVPLVDPETGQPLTVTQTFETPYTGPGLDAITIKHKTELVA